SGMIAAFELMTGNPVPIRAVQRNQPGLLTQFDCNENRATMVGGGRVYGRYLHLTLRWFECGNPNLPERARSPPHRIYEATISVSCLVSLTSSNSMASPASTSSSSVIRCAVPLRG